MAKLKQISILFTKMSMVVSEKLGTLVRKHAFYSGSQSLNSTEVALLFP